MSTRTGSRGSDLNNPAHEGSSRDSDLCQRILGIDLAIRAAAIIDGAHITGFASTARTNNVLEDREFRDKIGIWTQMVTEIGRQTEQYFGDLENISFRMGRLTLVTTPLSKTRSLGLSIDKSVAETQLIARILTRLDLKSS